MGRNRVYIGRLANRTRERDIDDTFSRYGRINSVDLKIGFAFVEFDDSRDAEDAIRSMDGRDFDGSRIIVEYSKPEDRRRRGRSSSRSRSRSRSRDRYSRKSSRRSTRAPPRRSDYRIRIENLPRDASWQDLKDHFRKAGDTVFADVFREAPGCNTREGIIEYKSSDDMRRAVKELNGSNFKGNTLTVKEDKKRSSSRSRSRSRSSSRNRRSRRRKSSRSRSKSPRRRRSSRSRSRSPRRRSSRSKSPVRGRRSSRSKSPATRKRSGSRSRSRSPVVNGDSKKSVSRSRSPVDAAPAGENAPARSPSRSPKRSPAQEDTKMETNDAPGESVATE
eukprot:TRINITY_DN2710_c0_g1_i2.p1 TRINITY_DN2710_c0_g1~~TRINITY_DN2710_c0_g1_i2.p1  ORF type:complete len:341 (+),score=95.47 TRINITY_DN2710_c0_g1_i2:23-1024(+)